MHKKTKAVAMSGIFGTFAFTLMTLGAVVPAATFAIPCFAGILLLLPGIEYGFSYSWLTYAAVSILSFFFVSDKEMSLIFLFFFGFYPLVKIYLEKIKHKGIRFCCKQLLFNICILTLYSIILFLFPLPSVQQEFEKTSKLFIAGLWLFANVTFILYDLAVTRAVMIYFVKLRPRFAFLFRS